MKEKTKKRIWKTVVVMVTVAMILSLTLPFFSI
jgi:cytochrome c-type biogenesis protein CcmE